MITRAIKGQLLRTVAKNRAMLLNEAQTISGFMHLLMKHRNTGEIWTREEKQLLKMHLLHLSCYVPALAIFALPFGSLLIPVLAEILDRRSIHRKARAEDLDEARQGPAIA
jgi:hypothetical protein